MTDPTHEPAAPGPLALVGSGEYLPQMLAVEASLLNGRAPRYVQIPTAAAPEGQAVLDRWVRLGREQAERLGVDAVPIVARDRDEANDPALAALVQGAGLVYMSGGNPRVLADALRGTLLWQAVESAWRGGAALAGCSAGAMALTAWTPTVRPRRSDDEGAPGLGVLPHLRVIPHFDRMAGWIPDLITRVLLHAPDGVSVLGIDEDTAVVGGPHEWRVEGRQSAWLLGHGARQEFPAGSTVVTPG